jgi:hypothetical protein
MVHKSLTLEVLPRRGVPAPLGRRGLPRLLQSWMLVGSATTLSSPPVCSASLAVIQVGAQVRSDSGKPLGEVARLFTLGKPITLTGTAAVPLFVSGQPLIANGRIFLSDHLGHRVIVYDTAGRFIRAVGSRGTGPGEFQMPYGIGIDQAHHLYVNDRANARVQVFDLEFNLLSMIRTPGGQNEQLFILHDDDSVRVLLQGVIRCPEMPREVCLFSEYDLAGRQLSVYGSIEPNVVMYTWRAARGRDGTMYVANALGSAIAIYSRDGRLVGTLQLASPAMERFRADSEPRSSRQMGRLLERLRSEPYTAIRSLVVRDRLAYVQLERHNYPSAPGPRFMLDVYRLDGCLVLHGLSTPGQLIESEGRLYFLNHSDVNNGQVVLVPTTPRATAEKALPCEEAPVGKGRGLRTPIETVHN